ncbi:hypothetical protein HCH_03520 [Hahella chejuensis KCTC 2396]|uniref:Uncharacterized protein n=1 Tax=Hahella chejuensis (strain KCTC 2396) TaxID=349521 RepID=Q2SGF9_HAHCH|nr:hypothetical protein HCH_03520 [Hahella chejuensis KCTC 2396]
MPHGVRFGVTGKQPVANSVSSFKALLLLIRRIHAPDY